MSFDKILFSRYLEFYDSLGLACIPLKFGDKPPLVAWKNQKQHSDDVARYDNVVKMDISTFDWWKEFNIGVLCGPVSGNLLVFDFDHSDTSTARLKQLDTLTVKTSRGYHVWLRITKPVAFTSNRRGLDVKWNGYVVVPPSVHPSGHIYTFINNPRKIRIVADMPEAFNVLGLPPPRIRLNREISVAEDAQLPPRPDWAQEFWGATIEEGMRHRMGLYFISLLARNPPYGQGIKDKHILLEHLSRWNRVKCKPPMNERDLPHIVESGLVTPYTPLRYPFLPGE